MGDYSKGSDMVAYLQPGKEAQRNAMCCVLKWLRSAIAKLIVVAPANQYSTCSTDEVSRYLDHVTVTVRDMVL